MHALGLKGLPMRQVFLSTPWIHRPADPDIVRFFNAEGRWLRLPAGACIFNGGDAGEIALVLSGLGAFSFQDARGHNHIFTLVFPGRLMGDVDGLTGSMVNVTDMALRETEVRLVSREAFTQFLKDNPDIQRKHAVGVIADHESDMEGMIANFTLPAPDRISALFASLVHNLGIELSEDGYYVLNDSLSTVEISEITATARPTVSSILSLWQAESLLLKRGRCMAINPLLFEKLMDWTTHGALPATRVRKRRRKKAETYTAPIENIVS